MRNLIEATPIPKIYSFTKVCLTILMLLFIILTILIVTQHDFNEYYDKIKEFLV